MHTWWSGEGRGTEGKRKESGFVCCISTVIGHAHSLSYSTLFAQDAISPWVWYWRWKTKFCSYISCRPSAWSNKFYCCV